MQATQATLTSRSAAVAARSAELIKRRTLLRHGWYQILLDQPAPPTARRRPRRHLLRDVLKQLHVLALATRQTAD